MAWLRGFAIRGSGRRGDSRIRPAAGNQRPVHQRGRRSGRRAQGAGEAAKKLAEQGYRTSLVLHMDIRPGFTGQLTEKPKLVDEILADKQAK